MTTYITYRQAFEKMLAEINPCDSDGDDIDKDVQLESDIDSDLSSDDEPQPGKRARVSDGAGAVWREEQQGAPLPITQQEAHAADGEPTITARKRVSSRLQSFSCFFTPEMLRVIQQWTIQHGQQTERDDWFMSLNELMAFFAVVILRGIFRTDLDHWGCLEIRHITRIMSRDRFESIMRHLRFDDRLTRSERVKSDKFAAVSDVWASFVSNCIGSYSPGRDITVDQQLLPCKTRCSFLQYTTAEPVQFGIRFWVACDLESKYVCNLVPCVGINPARPRRERPSEEIVMRLMEPFLDRGRSVTTGASFTSLSLARRLLGRKTTILGRVDPKRRDFPRCDRRPQRDESITQVFSTTGVSLTVFARHRRKTVSVLSSLHSEVHTDWGSPRDRAYGKPNTVSQYNSTKSGVEAMEQTLREFTVRKETRRWPVAVFYHMVDVAALNARVLYEACSGTRERRADFLLELAKELSRAHLEEKAAQNPQLFLRCVECGDVWPSDAECHCDDCEPMDSADCEHD